MLIFRDKTKAVITGNDQNPQQVLVKINLSSEEENQLNTIYETIQQVKAVYDFSNLDSYFATLARNFEISEDAEASRLNELDYVRDFLKMFILSNFFKPDEKHSKKLVLNFRDHSFIQRFRDIVHSAFFQKLVFLNLKPLFQNE